MADSLYTVDGVKVTRDQALRVIMLAWGVERAEAAADLDEFRRVDAAASVVRKTELPDRRAMRVPIGGER